MLLAHALKWLSIRIWPLYLKTDFRHLWDLAESFQFPQAHYSVDLLTVQMPERNSFERTGSQYL